MGKVAADLLSGGADLLQLRAKGIPLETVTAAAREIIPLCRAAGVPFILNDYPELAAELGADGVHIGQEDGEIYDVRSRIGAGMVIGRSTHSLAQARRALDDGADYIGFGPLSPPPRKRGARPSGCGGGGDGAGSRIANPRLLHRRDQAGKSPRSAGGGSKKVRGRLPSPHRPRYFLGDKCGEILHTRPVIQLAQNQLWKQGRPLFPDRDLGKARHSLQGNRQPGCRGRHDP